MIVLVLVLLAACVMAPLLLTLRGGASLRSRRELALDLHRAQLGELERDRAADRISADDLATARLEIQRRILATADTPTEAAEPPERRRPSWVVVFAALLIPLGGAALYLIGGHPDMPGVPYASRMQDTTARMEEQEHLIQQLRDKLVQLDPKSDQARQGYVLLGNIEDSRGNLPAAAIAWHTALDIRFDATLAAETAEAMTEVAGHITPQAEALFRSALAAAPSDAPWRPLVDKRLAELAGPITPTTPPATNPGATAPPT